MIESIVIIPDKVMEFKVHGESKVDEISDTIQSYYGTFTQGALWNLDDGDTSHLTPDDMDDIADCSKKYAIHLRNAYYTTSELEFAMLRMYESYAEIQSVKTQMRVFKNRDEALHWLNKV